MRNKKTKARAKIEFSVKQAAAEFSRKVREQIVTAISAAFGFVIALYWKDIVVEAVDRILEKMKIVDGFVYKIIAAIIVTIICVAGMLFIGRLLFKKK